MTADDPTQHARGDALPTVVNKDGEAALRFEKAFPPDRRIGPYRVLREIGRGGMGAVYLAARADEQFEKHVAIKLVRGGPDSAEIVERFRRERQILASFDHPCIARMLDGGTTEDGFPYFVMEYIEGEPLDHYCDSRALPVTERLKLFASVCSAVQYAHRNLVVHRDLKPRNILVTSEGVLKLLDFGIAKLLNPDSPAEGQTVTGFVALTPEYASPEQVRGEPISTATDVYSLGVILYRLLTDRLPYRVRSRQVLEIVRAVCEEEPERPSQAVGDFSPLRKPLEGDLDTIVMTALRKDPLRRYPSVEALGEDVRRHLEGLPVAARKPTFSYRAQKFLKRHWLGVAATALVFTVLITAGIALAIQSARVARERDKAQKVSDFLVNLFRVSDPGEARGNTITAREILDKGSEEIRSELEEQPEVRAALMSTMGVVYTTLGLYDRALPLLEEALELRRQTLGEHLDVAQSLTELAFVLDQKGDYRTAEALDREALAMERRLLGSEHEVVADTMNDLASVLYNKGDSQAAEALWREVLPMQRKLLGNDHAAVASTLNNLAGMAFDRGDYSGAAELWRETLEMHRSLTGEGHPVVASGLSNLAGALFEMGNARGAEVLHREALALRRKVFGVDHPDVAASLSNLAVVLREEGDAGEAGRLQSEALASRRKTLGHEHRDVAESLSGLADALSDAGLLDAAKIRYEEALAIRRKVLPSLHPDLADTLLGLGIVLTNQGEAGAAEPLLREALEIRERSYLAGNWRTAEVRSALGACLVAQQRYQEAEPFLLDAYSSLKARDSSARASRETRERLFLLYEGWGRTDEAARYGRESSAAAVPH
jgi:serine/threonine-protein kinase